ncbi:hypothetical protein L227DRAFT_612361 [Lentinus tigrinus ALCF2SS1-6]|uniref:DUF6533 domain-containing protein n=1 Tax=Lentinus tigrinus ALCF2SS1-6 TaxID=1328759 RepID=A0A5C2S5K2_9APHY|nr:hypothetical protein L227DRAFT_612361 [Lentinus tigrinus ALCF2SS1-6]
MPSNADAAALAAIYSALYTESYCNVAASVLFMYDSIVTSTREVACFRTAKWSGAKVLFLANKGISVIFFVMNFVIYASFPSDKRFVPNFCVDMLLLSVCSCSLFRKIFTVIPALQMIPWAVYSGLRARALNGKYFGLLVFALSVAPVVVIASRVPLMIADMSIIYITWTKLSSKDVFNLKRGMWQSQRPSLPYVLIRDGTVYFIVLFTLNMLHLIFIALSVALDGNNTTYVTTFTSPLTAILVSRFLLQLQEASLVTVRVDSDDPLHMSLNGSEDMPSFVRSLGGVIDPDLPRDDFDDPEPDLQSHSEFGEEREQTSPAAEPSSQA